MGAGKTTVGRMLSKQLSIPVIDTDHWVEDNQQKSIKDIFQENGEEFFRALETEALKELCMNSRNIITTGGGIVLRHENRQLMKDHGFVVFLYCDLEETTRRLAEDQSRPLFKADISANKIRFEERLPFYQEADKTINTTKKSVDEIVTEIIASLE